MKKITKKQIREAIKNCNVTKLHQYCYLLTGSNNYYDVLDFINNYGTSRRACSRCSNDVSITRLYRVRNISQFKPTLFENCVNELRETIKIGKLNNYSKLPFLGVTHLYFCSPDYGHSDYNKWRTFELKGNEKRAELLCKLAHKYFNY